MITLSNFFKRNKGTIVFVALILLIVLLSATSVYFYKKYATVSGDQRAVSQKEMAHLVQAVSKIMILPEDETPTVATVSDPSLLKDQEFFLKAKQGDKVLIYTKSKLAILYDPKAKKIVNVAPVNLGSGTSIGTQ